MSIYIWNAFGASVMAFLLGCLVTWVLEDKRNDKK